MAFKTFPLNNIQYTAEDMEVFLCSRTQGVYATTGNFSASVTGTDRTVTISGGKAWIKNGDYAGKSVCSTENETVTIAAANASNPRIDRIVLRFSYTANASNIAVIQGTASASPVAPAVSRVANGNWELGLYEVYIPANSVYVTAEHITNTMADPTVCGVMTDGVDGLPTGAIYEQYRGIIEDYEDKLEEAIEAYRTAAAGGPLDYNALANVPTVDSVATSGSANLITSGQVYEAAKKTGTANASGTKLYLAGAASQAVSAETKSNSNCYIGTDNSLYSNGMMVLTNGAAATVKGSKQSITGDGIVQSISGLSAGTYLICAYGNGKVTGTSSTREYCKFSLRKNTTDISGFHCNPTYTATTEFSGFFVFAVATVSASDAINLYAKLTHQVGVTLDSEKTSISYFKIA